MESVGRRALLLGASAAIALLVARRLWRSDVHQSHRGVGPLRLCWWALRTRRLRAALSETDGPSVDRACTVAGVDISFIKGSDTDACAGLVVLELSSLNVLYEDMERVTLTAPYVPGYLAFREVRAGGACLPQPACARRPTRSHRLDLALTVWDIN